ncbi:capsule biosynthesis GfcC family protein [uncultured Tolumonas sp.]|uniref:capsule biosynthesis GfcC family protein n=1 Tax=uncultured Tolumonas sp. TaxID=263765 RepID=UPI00292DB3C7|nr:capsule biosynthesis GfcC family protein [uncultured Tolumonas sp.]
MLYLIRIIVLIIFTGTFVQSAELKMFYQHIAISSIQLADGARLDQFYSRLHLTQDIDWNTSLITSPTAQKYFELRSLILKKKLEQLEYYWLQQGETGLTQSVRQLKNELFKISVAGRIKAELDPDIIRLQVEFNRPLIGHYSLYTAPHHEFLYLQGLINAKSIITLQSGWSIEQYVNNTTRLVGADESMGYLIEGNGQWKQVPLAYWNKKHIEPAPGATLFIGFEPTLLPDEMSDVNTLIADYIANRIPQ